MILGCQSFPLSDHPMQESEEILDDTPIDALGWRGSSPDAPEIAALRTRLSENNGIAGLEIAAPNQIDRAVGLFRRDGFVVVENVLNGSQLRTMQAACATAIRDIVRLDRERQGNRGSHRYSFSASTTGSMLHTPEWAMLIDLPTVTPIITALFESADYHVRKAAGDFCLPGSEYQHLHSDIADRQQFGSFYDPSGRISLRDLPCPVVCCNFLMVDFTTTNGPTRQIPGTQNSRQPIPTLAEEPDWMKYSTVCPAKAGGVLIRDIRAWHGGTPNLSDHVRAIPNAIFLAPWFHEPAVESMPLSIFETLSEHGQKLCKQLVAREPLDVSYRIVSPGPAGKKS